MTLSLTLAAIWVIAATAVAFLPMRLQYAPGLLLLALALPLLIFIAVQHGIWIVLLVLAGFASMFRRPLAVLLRYLLGRMKRGES